MEDPISENHRIHDWLVGGYRGITYVDDSGQEVTPTIRLLATDPADNDWLVANQVTVRRLDAHRWFDLVAFCNGMPVSTAVQRSWQNVPLFVEESSRLGPHSVSGGAPLSRARRTATAA